MVRLREIPRTATFAWSPGPASPLVATGTRAGAVDVNFSNETCLEIWDLGLGRQDASEELQPVGKITTDSGYVSGCSTCCGKATTRAMLTGAFLQLQRLGVDRIRRQLAGRDSRSSGEWLVGSVGC